MECSSLTFATKSTLRQYVLYEMIEENSWKRWKEGDKEGLKKPKKKEIFRRAEIWHKHGTKTANEKCWGRKKCERNLRDKLCYLIYGQIWEIWWRNYVYSSEKFPPEKHSKYREFLSHAKYPKEIYAPTRLATDKLSWLMGLRNLICFPSEECQKFSLLKWFCIGELELDLRNIGGFKIV